MKFLISIILLVLSNSVFSITFKDCNSDQKKQLIFATERAEMYTSFVIEEIDIEQFSKWMGFNESADIKETFKLMRNVLAVKYLDFSCDCFTNQYARATTNKDYEILICQDFWKAPEDGWDSRAGTLIHELSHFDDIRQTHDFIKDRYECLSEAKTKIGQRKIIQNANSYEYLAEDIAAKRLNINIDN